MNCANHPEAPAVAFCRTCGKPLCQVCQRPAQGTIFCEEHVAAAAPAAATTATAPPPPPPSSTPPGTGYSPYTSPYTATDPAVSPGLAFLLGLIPGVGAIYNGQYAKGIVHVLIFGTLISIISTGAAAGGFEPLIGLMIGLMFPYMAFEAYHTAQKAPARRTHRRIFLPAAFARPGLRVPHRAHPAHPAGRAVPPEHARRHPFLPDHALVAGVPDRSRRVPALYARGSFAGSRRKHAGGPL